MNADSSEMDRIGDVVDAILGWVAVVAMIVGGVVLFVKAMT